jgi:DNA-binding transcriptional regulator GbsR (MarR family)
MEKQSNEKKENDRKMEDEFIEKFALFLEKNSIFPRIAGRIYGYLLISDPPYQSPKELVERLSITKSSVSTVMRLLIQPELVEEMTIPGERSRYFQVKPGAWEKQFMENLKSVTRARQMLDEGLQILRDKNPKLKNRIQRLDRLYLFLEQELPSLMERWKVFTELGE